MAIREEEQHRERYDARHVLHAHEVSRAVEREAVGSDYGNTGFTTRQQADRLVDLLQLRRGDLLLDIGAGAGWPGLYLSARSGCRVVVSDLSPTGMAEARRRAVADHMAGRTHAVAATARRLPFKPEQFDAIVHSDVLC